MLEPKTAVLEENATAGALDTEFDKANSASYVVLTADAVAALLVDADDTLFTNRLQYPVAVMDPDTCTSLDVKVSNGAVPITVPRRIRWVLLVVRIKKSSVTAPVNI